MQLDSFAIKFYGIIVLGMLLAAAVFVLIIYFFLQPMTPKGRKIGIFEFIFLSPAQVDARAAKEPRKDPKKYPSKKEIESGFRRMIAIVVGIIVLVAVYHTQRIARLEIGGLRTEGEVVRFIAVRHATSRNGGYHYSYDPIVVFTTSRNQVVKFRDDFDYFSSGYIHKHEKVPVLYLAGGPVIIDRGVYNWYWPGIWSLFAAVCLRLCFITPAKNDSYKKKMREAATGLGFTMEEAERDCPTIETNGDVTFNKEKCVKLSLNQPGREKQDWALLQKFPDKKDAVLPNGFVLVTSPSSPDLLKKVQSLAKAYGDDFYEFERAGNVLSVFCYQADKQTLAKLYKSLAALDA